MFNNISMGHNRKIKKKLKKLSKKLDNPDQIFKEVSKFKQRIIKNQQKTVFNPVNELEKRR